VVVIGPLPPPVHGAALVTAAVMDRLVRTGASIHVINTRGTRHRRPMGYHFSRAVVHLRGVGSLWRGRRRKVRTLYITGAGGAGLWYQAALALIGRLLGYQVFVHHHSFSYLRTRRYAMVALTVAAGKTARHITLCERMSQLLVRRYRSVRNTVICSNAGVLAPAQLRNPGRRRGAGLTEVPPLAVGHLSNLSVDKGLGLVFESMRALREVAIPARFLLAGAPSDARGTKVLNAGRTEFRDSLEYYGPLERHEVDLFLEKLDVFLFPSTYEHEAEPLVVLEAARCGVPAIAFDVGCIRGLVVDPSWLVPLSASFPAAVIRMAEGMVGSAEREAIRGRTARMFARRHRESASAYDALVALLLGETTAL
jgi:glycosyltransferase involved in cell wall biosynthesis